MLASRFRTKNMVVEAVFSALDNPTLLCVLGSRMFFNLLEAGERGVNGGTNWSSHARTSTNIGFGEVQNTVHESYVVDCLHIRAPSMLIKATQFRIFPDGFWFLAACRIY